MTDGCYDIDGKCTVCGDFHPCRCETENYGSQRLSKEAIAIIKPEWDAMVDFLDECEGDDL